MILDYITIMNRRYFYFLFFSRTSIKASASSDVFTLNKTGVGGGFESGVGRHTNIILFLFMRFNGILSLKSVFNRIFPNELPARTINCILSFGVGFKNNVPTPRSPKFPSFFTKTLHLKFRKKIMVLKEKFSFRIFIYIEQALNNISP